MFLVRPWRLLFGLRVAFSHLDKDGILRAGTPHSWLHGPPMASQNDPDAPPLDPDAPSVEPVWDEDEGEPVANLTAEEVADFTTPLDVSGLRMERRVVSLAKSKVLGGRVTELTWDKFKNICALICETGVKNRACEAVGFRYDTVRTAVQQQVALGNPEWQELWDLSFASFREGLEAEARSRAVDGWKEPIFGKGGELKGYVRRKSDRLLELMLKAHIPHYTEKVQHSIALEGGGMDILKDLSMDAKKRIRDIIIEDLRAQALLTPVGAIEGEVAA